MVILKKMPHCDWHHCVLSIRMVETDVVVCVYYSVVGIGTSVKLSIPKLSMRIIYVVSIYKRTYRY